MKELLNTSDNYQMPSKSIKQVERALHNGGKLRFTVLSCPDYDSSGDQYVFGNLNSGVPLLTKLHVGGVLELIRSIDPSQVMIEVLIADIESENPHLVGLYTDGDHEEYKRRCQLSELAIASYLDQVSPDTTNSSSSFMKLRDPVDPDRTFLDIRERYFEVLQHCFAGDRALTDIVSRNVRQKQNCGYFDQEYGGKLDPSEMFSQELVTMAEYLALSCILGKRALLEEVITVVVIHSGNNVFLLNKAKQYSPGEFGVPPMQPKLPILTRTKSVVA